MRMTILIVLISTFFFPSVLASQGLTDDCPTEINGGLRGESGNIQDHMFHSIAIDPTNENIVYAGTETNGAFKTTDGGTTWSRLRIGFKCTQQKTGYSQIFDIAIDPTNPMVLYASAINGPGPASPPTFPSASGGVYKSTDGGLTWTQKNEGLTNTYVTYVLVDSTNPNRLYAGVGGLKTSFPGSTSGFADGGVWVSDNGADSWSPLPLPPGVNTNIFIDMVLRGTNQRTIYLSAQGHGTDVPIAYGFLRSTDGGQTWTISNPTGQTINGFDSFKADPNILYGHDLSTGRKVHKSTDGGLTWTQLQAGFFGVVRIHPTNSQIAYFTGQRNLLKTTDGFLTQTETYNDPDLPSFSQMVDIKISPTNPNVVWAAAKGYYLYKTANAGQTWTKITTIRDMVYGNPLSQNLPAVVSTPDAVTGLAVVNTDATSGVSLTLTSYRNDGSSLGPVSFTVPAKGQISRLSSELFGTTGADGGWIKVTANRAGIKGFFLNFDSALEMMDGAPFMNRPVNDFVLPELRNADISIVNPGNTPIDVTLKVIGDAGAELASPSTVQISPNGRYSTRMDTPDAYLRVSSSQAFVASEQFGTPGRSTNFVDGLIADLGARFLYSPQYVVGAGYKSKLTLVNLENMQTTVNLSWFRNDGTSIAANVQVVLPSLGRTTIIDADRFAVTAPGSGLDGFLVITSSITRITGAVQFGDSVQERFQTTLPLLTTPYSETVFAHVAQNSTYFTGVAIINRNSAPANVSISIFNASGVQVGSGTRTIASNARISELLTQIDPQLPPLTGGYFKVSADRPVYSFAVFGTNSLSVLATVPAQN
jgi:photosystem II stability/assembly factor-like uncharacterized protein